MKIAIGSDHGGFKVKEQLINFLKKQQYLIIDCGCYSEESCNYAQFAIETAKKVAKNEASIGILICTSGEGVCIAANKIPGIRCGIGYNDEVSKLIKEHNDCNMIAFGARFQTIDEIFRRTQIFIEAKFQGGRHLERVNFIRSIEK